MERLMAFQDSFIVEGLQQCYSTNSNPKIIAGYFIAEVEKRMGTAARIRADLGTENVTMAELQRLLRWSTHRHVRIESGWGFLRTHHAQDWMNRFHKLKDHDCFSGDFLDKQLVLFTCLNIIKERYIILCSHWYFSSTGIAAASCTLVQYPHYPQKQKCSSSKWTSNSHVHCPSSIWMTRSPERGLSGSSGSL
ncbi:hypothetical protein N1851_031177 [Merluccius polli]|uniref:Uncharacterized protein n=1 Tax=Merluccius polli TaxID=89951 RepID=A0AA47M484_MERPO|nr:hypothetical protein N1851_031177 [Merluccius polli]